MDNNLKHRLPDMVRKVLYNHSGGVKLTELVAEIFSELASHNELPLNFVEEFEQELAQMGKFGISLLDYVWDMSGNGMGPMRAKTFVYTTR